METVIELWEEGRQARRCARCYAARHVVCVCTELDTAAASRPLVVRPETSAVFFATKLQERCEESRDLAPRGAPAVGSHDFSQAPSFRRPC